VGSVFLSVILIYPVYDRWQNNPTITTIESLNFPISEIHFPAVTICPNVRYLYDRFEDAIEKEP
jgi:hypothetical protein